MAMSVSEIEVELAREGARLVDLQAESSIEVMEANGSDVGYRTIRGSKGTSQEIAASRKRIVELSAQLKNARMATNRPQQQEQDNASEQEKDEKIRLEEQYKEFIFNQLKNSYKKNSNKWHKFMMLLQGKAPNWNKISSYTQEELNYLMAAYSGSTKFQEEKSEKIIKKYSDVKKSLEKIRRSNWDTFTRLLASREQLQEFINYEERRRSV